MNKIQEIFKLVRDELESAVANGDMTQEALDDLNPKMDMNLNDHSEFQQRKSLAVADGSLSVEDGMVLYQTLGGSSKHFNKKDTHIKIAVLKIVSLLGK